VQNDIKQGIHNNHRNTQGINRQVSGNSCVQWVQTKDYGKCSSWWGGDGMGKGTLVDTQGTPTRHCDTIWVLITSGIPRSRVPESQMLKITSTGWSILVQMYQRPALFTN